LAQLVDEFPKIRLYFLGDHVIDEYRPYKEELDALIDHYGIGDHVHFTGWRKDALAVMSQMDLVIHPSLSEGFGRAVLESMALGKPVIASAVGGLREAIKDGRNGFLVAPGDTEAIRQRWRELAISPKLRQDLGAQARRTVFSEYLIDDKVSRLASIWRAMAGERSERCAA
jgi:glycosyltransferase involved in cell wall biosynthesis